MPPDFEQLLLSDPTDRALDPIAEGLGKSAQQRLAHVRAFEHRLGAALAVEVPTGLDATLGALPQQVPLMFRLAAANELQPSSEMDQQLVRALAVPVPENWVGDLLALAPRADPAQSHPRTRHWFSRGGPFALAASVLLCVGLAASWWFGAGAQDETATAVDPLLVATVEHLSHEPYALTRTERVPQTAVDALLAQVGLRLAKPVEVNYAYPCPIGGQRTLHMVMQAASGPVTVIYFRDAAAAEIDQFSHGGLHGRSLSYGDGMLVLIGSSSADFDRLERVWRGALKA